MKHILLIEDDLSLINGLSFAIQKQGYEITVIRTAAEAGVVWTNKRFDMVILDVSLPDGSGYDICKKNTPGLKRPDYFFDRRRRGNRHYHGT